MNMPCRVGITTNPELRKRQWEAKVVGLTNWRILGTYRNRAEAQDREDKYAERHGCRAHHGGADAAGMWSVYRFDYIRTR